MAERLNLDKWDDFEIYMDEHFEPDFKWRERINWEEEFKRTERTYFTLSLGFEVTLEIPYSVFHAMDQKKEDARKIGVFVKEIVTAIETLIN